MGLLDINHGMCTKGQSASMAVGSYGWRNYNSLNNLKF